MGSDQPVAEVVEAQLRADHRASVLAGNAAALGITPASVRTASHPA
jgi:aminocarboxymuconate-semialdehyde decarboxylase